MNQLSLDEGTAESARIADERGFTLIELLVAMVVSLIVIGGGVYGIARAFKVSTSTTARVTATSNAEVQIEKLELDLRDAINGGCFYNGNAVTGVSVTLAGSITTLELCDPNTNLVSTATPNLPPSIGVQWQCNTGTTGTSPPAQTCIRSIDTGTKILPAIATNNRITGVQTLNLSGIVNSQTYFLPCDTATVCSSDGTQTYSLSAGSLSLSWVGISASVAQLSSPGAGQTATVNATSAVLVTTGAALLNFGTS